MKECVSGNPRFLRSFVSTWSTPWNNWRNFTGLLGKPDKAAEWESVAQTRKTVSK